MSLRFLTRRGKKSPSTPSTTAPTKDDDGDDNTATTTSSGAATNVPIDTGTKDRSKGKGKTKSKSKTKSAPNLKKGAANKNTKSTKSTKSSTTTDRSTSTGSRQKSTIYKVKIPPSTKPGQEFQVKVNTRTVRIRCPPNARPGQSLQITVPDTADPPPSAPAPGRGGGGESFLVVVPEGVQPGDPFTLSANGIRFTVTCPPSASGGRRIRFHLPPRYGRSENDGATAARDDGDGQRRTVIETYRLDYDVEGWARTLLLTDDGGKFQWTRVRSTADTAAEPPPRGPGHAGRISKRLHRNAHVRRVTARSVSLVPAHRALSVGTVLSLPTGASPDRPTVLASCTDIAQVQSRPLAEKTAWFRSVCSRLTDGGRAVHLPVRREYLLRDSMTAVLSMDPIDLHRTWRINFTDEEGIDAGGLTREWFELVTDEVFDPDMGLWQTSPSNQMCMQINPASEISCPDDHLIYFRFIGRVMGKAMFDRQLVKGHMVKHLYKHILGFPVMFSDLKDVDEEYYNSLKGLKDMGSDVEYVGVDFTVMEETLGVKQTVELVPGGGDMDVVESNLPGYVEACLKYRLLGRYEAQLNELLLGFFDVIPEPLLTIFDFQELELLMCGLPNIDMENWMEHTEYSGEYDREGPNHMVCKWFWETVEGYDQELRARLLQFVTGTSGVPAKGFSSLQGNDGNVRKFTIHGVTLDTCLYPRSHTCFNRIDLPLYEDRADCEEKLKIAITMASTGFDIE